MAVTCRPAPMRAPGGRADLILLVSSFDYYLPPELIAQYPAPERQAARLLVLRRDSGEIEHRLFSDLPDYLAPGDLLVLNETRVFPARLHGRLADTGGRLEVLLLRERQPGVWETLVQPGRRALPGVSILFGDGSLRAEVRERHPEGGRLLAFTPGEPELFWPRLRQLGEVPLPPYIKRRPKRPTGSATRQSTPGLPDRWLHLPQGCTLRGSCLTGSGSRGVNTAFYCCTSAWALSARSRQSRWRSTRCTRSSGCWAGARRH